MDVPREVVEASVFWGGDLFAVKYFAVGDPVFFDDVPKAASVEVRTRVVEAAPKTPRNRWDLPLGALAITAALANVMVVASLAHPVARASTLTEEGRLLHAGPSEASGEIEPRATEFSPFGVIGARVDETPAPSGDDDAAAEPKVDAFRDNGMIGLLGRFRGEDVNDVVAPWAPEPVGNGIHGTSIDEAWGVAGISLSGVGEGGGGGGGNGNGVVLDRVHTQPAVGSGHGHLAGHHVGFVCHLPVVTAISCYRIPPEIIQRVVRKSMGRFRACYEDGLRSNPVLAGRVVTKFVISRDGSVAAASDGGSDLADTKVRECVQRAFMSLEFPANPDGIATVTYPIVMSPEE
jgi:hypothetical protein